jgi:hypothetical protein
MLSAIVVDDAVLRGGTLSFTLGAKGLDKPGACARRRGGGRHVSWS